MSALTTLGFAAKMTRPSKKIALTAVCGILTPGKQAGPAAGAREGSKAAKVLRPSEAAGWCFTERACESHGWLAHSVRAYLSGTVSQRMKLKLVFTKSEDRERRIPSQGRLAQFIQIKSRRVILGGFSLFTLEIGPDALSWQGSVLSATAHQEVHLEQCSGANSCQVQRHEPYW